MASSADFWNALAPHHSAIENSYLDLPSLRRIAPHMDEPVLVVGAGQGLIVAALRKKGVQCDGVDSSAEMIRYASMRRGLDLVQADAKALPFGKGTYRTILYATGVVDFMSDEGEIQVILNEARRIAGQTGSIIVAFYRLSAATEVFVARLGLLSNHILRHRDILEIYRLNPVQAVAWVADRAKVGYARALWMSLRSWASSTWQEKRNAFHMQRMFSTAARGETLIQAAPENQPYRNESEIWNLFTRLAIPIKELRVLRGCFIVHI